MKPYITGLILLAGLAVGNAQGAFFSPTLEQLQAAAKRPAELEALLQDASVPQAAEVARDVIVEIVKLDLDPDNLETRIRLLMENLFRLYPDDARALAIVLGRFVADSPTASMSPALLSAVQRGIIFAAGLESGETFGNAYHLAMQTVAGRPGGGKNVPPPPPPPPVALPPERGPPPVIPPRPPVARPYRAQQLP